MALAERTKMRRFDDLLHKIAAMLDRFDGEPAGGTDWLACPAYVWTGHGARGVAAIDAPGLDLLHGIDRQKREVAENVARLAAGHAAHDMLLWGARGMGKSALVRSAVRAAQA